MKTSVKILLLIVVAALAVGGVLYYMKTIVSPPQQLEYPNQFAAHLDSVATASGRASLEQLEAGLDPTLDLISRFISEGALEAVDADKPMSAYVTNYAKSLNADALSMFHSRYWPHDKVMSISGRVDRLQAMTLSNGVSAAVQEEAVSNDFNRINDIIGKYLSARRIIFRRGFTGISSARDDINQAQQLAQDADLQPNESLISDLNEVQSVRARAHVSYMSSLVSNLSYLYNFSYYDDYNRASDKALNEVVSYEQYGPGLYGSYYSSSSANDLRSRISNANSFARSHFNSTNVSEPIYY